MPGPFSQLDQRISYNEMNRNRMISQYQQSIVSPRSMPMSHQYKVANEERFQYGVTGGQDPRHYQRQAQLSRLGTAGAVGGGSMDIGMWGAGELAVGAMGIGGAMGFLAPLAASMIPMHFINKGVQNTLQRQRFMHSTASDLDQYRGRIGINDLTYNKSTALGGMLAANMSAPGQFFNKSQQSEIHKIALSNDMISAKGGADPGTMKQYTKNFEELKKTTEDVVKLLQTTASGGLSVIKELQKSGFGNLQQIKQQVVQAKALGGMTGIGSQNMMSIAAAGQQAGGAVGANAYQSGAVAASNMANYNAAGASAVRRAGGVAQAGGALGQAMMRTMSTGMGDRMMAYAMDKNGQFNNERLNNLMTGQVSTYGVVSGSQDTGYAMGEDKVMFGRYKQQRLEELSQNPFAMENLTRQTFEKWSEERPYSKARNKAWVFSQKMGGGELMYQMLLSNPNVSKRNAATAVTRASTIDTKRPYKQTSLARNIGVVGGKVGEFFNEVGADLLYGSQDFIGGIGRGFSDIGKGFGDLGTGLMQATGLWDDLGSPWKKGKAGTNYLENMKKLYGLGGGPTKQEVTAFSQLTTAEQKEGVIKQSTEPVVQNMEQFDFYRKLIGGKTKEETAFVRKALQGIDQEDPMATLTDPAILSYFGFTKNKRVGSRLLTPADQMGRLQRSTGLRPMEFALNTGRGMQEVRDAMKSREGENKAMDLYGQWMTGPDRGWSDQKIRQSELNIENAKREITQGKLLRPDILTNDAGWRSGVFQKNTKLTRREAGVVVPFQERYLAEQASEELDVGESAMFTNIAAYKKAAVFAAKKAVGGKEDAKRSTTALDQMDIKRGNLGMAPGSKVWTDQANKFREAYQRATGIDIRDPDKDELDYEKTEIAIRAVLSAKRKKAGDDDFTDIDLKLLEEGDLNNLKMLDRLSEAYSKFDKLSRMRTQQGYIGKTNAMMASLDPSRYNKKTALGKKIRSKEGREAFRDDTFEAMAGGIDFDADAYLKEWGGVLETSFGIGKEQIKNLREEAKEKGSDFNLALGGFLTNSEKMQDVTSKTLADQRTLRLRSRVENLRRLESRYRISPDEEGYKDPAGVNIQSGYTRPKDLKDTSDALTLAEGELAQNLRLKAVDENDRGPSIRSTVRAPLLNYWNNSYYR